MQGVPRSGAMQRGGEQMKFGLTTVLFLIFLVLKLTGHIMWSWWWVTSPLWIGWGIIALLLLPLVIARLLETPAERSVRKLKAMMGK